MEDTNSYTKEKVANMYMMMEYEPYCHLTSWKIKRESFHSE
jgi:hypothetical protein